MLASLLLVSAVGSSVGGTVNNEGRQITRRYSFRLLKSHTSGSSPVKSTGSYGDNAEHLLREMSQSDAESKYDWDIVSVRHRCGAPSQQ